MEAEAGKKLIEQYKLATFESPANIRHIAQDSEWPEEEFHYLNALKSLHHTTYAADFLHTTKMIQRCTCWRLSSICTLFTSPRFNESICDSCAADEDGGMDLIRRKERIYFDDACKPLGRVTVFYDDPVTTAFQPSVNISSCCSFVAAMML